MLKLELCTLLLVFLFSFLQKVSGQQILARCIKDFVFGFVAHIHASHSKYLFGMDPKVLAIILLLFFSERENWEERFFLLHTILSKKNSNKAELKMHRHNKEVF